MVESGWYQRLVGCFLELLALLDKIDEGKKVNTMARRLMDIVFHELFWVAAGYDSKLEYHVEKLPPLNKEGVRSDQTVCGTRGTGDPVRARG